MLRSAEYIYNNIIIADEINSSKKYCKKAQVGVDLSVKNLYKITSPSTVKKDKTYVGDYKLVECQEISEGCKGWILEPNTTYICELNEGCKFGPNDTGLIIMRSSLNRSGVTIQSAVWDPNYTSQDGDKINTMSIRLTVDNNVGFNLEQNARVAQLLVFDNEDTTLYNGQFQGGRFTSKLTDNEKSQASN